MFRVLFSNTDNTKEFQTSKFLSVGFYFIQITFYCTILRFEGNSINMKYVFTFSTRTFAQGFPKP